MHEVSHVCILGLVKIVIIIFLLVSVLIDVIIIGDPLLVHILTSFDLHMLEFLKLLMLATKRYMEFCELQDKLQNKDVLVSEMSSLAVKSEKQYNLAGTWGVTF